MREERKKKQKKRASAVTTPTRRAGYPRKLADTGEGT